MKIDQIEAEISTFEVPGSKWNLLFQEVPGSKSTFTSRNFTFSMHVDV